MTDHLMVLNVMLSKIAINLKVYGSCEDVIALTLSLFQVRLLLLANPEYLHLHAAFLFKSTLEKCSYSLLLLAATRLHYCQDFGDLEAIHCASKLVPNKLF